MLSFENFTELSSLSWDTTPDDLLLVSSINETGNFTAVLNYAPRNATLNIPYTIMEALVAIVAVIGNSLVIIVFYRERRLRRRTNYYIISLALADFLVGLIGIPFAVLADIGLPKNLHACLLTLSALVVLCTISIFCLVAVSIDRYWAILHPLAYSRNVRTKTAIGIISLCWVFGSLIGFLPLFGWYNKGTKQECYFTDKMDYNYLVFLYFTTIITPSIILAVFYGLIYRVILKQVNKTTSSSIRVVSTSKNKSDASLSVSSPSAQRETQMLRLLNSAAHKREVKATQNLSIIVLFFIICWIPLYTINCVNAFCSECMLNQTIIYSAIILSHFNSAVNPLLYAYHLKDFRGALSRLFHCTSQPESLYRPSLISQHQQRMSEHYNSRRMFEPRIYVDSPVWKRQQNQLQVKSDVQDVNDDSGLNLSTSGAMQQFMIDNSNNNINGNGIENLSSIMPRRSSQSNVLNNKKIFFISDSGNELTCEPQNSSLYAIVRRNRDNDSI